MARIPRAAVGNTIYHVLNRANGREQIFNKEKDYLAFEKILFEAKEKHHGSYGWPYRGRIKRLQFRLDFLHRYAGGA